LKVQGFGVPTEIDMRATLATKVGADIQDYVILGACNPPLALRALGVDRSGCCCPATSSSAPTATAPPWSRRWTRS
jgi:hypothetical protein